MEEKLDLQLKVEYLRKINSLGLHVPNSNVGSMMYWKEHKDFEKSEPVSISSFISSLYDEVFDGEFDEEFEFDEFDEFDDFDDDEFEFSFDWRLEGF